VPHAGNSSTSTDEALVVRDLVAALEERVSWRAADGEVRPLGIEDILIVTPYNAQVAEISALLGPGARVGTVDRFQGQEAPVAIYSMATSSPEEAPRGMEFLYSPNRLNVATSRARCVAVIVGSPAIFSPDCVSPRQMRLANAFCRFRELAHPWPPPGEHPGSGPTHAAAPPRLESMPQPAPG